ncbi:hypothetical protein K402DRAFT_294663, partial [Aulographum hederae CBS 113979]
GLKRTASGLAKALDTRDEFDSENFLDSSWDEPINLDDIPSKGSKAEQTESVYFDEDDFDSDLDLDVEDPATKGTTPSKSIAQQPRNWQHPISTPSSRLPQNARSSTNSFAPKTSPDAPASVPWSSSPVEHLQPALKKKPEIQQYSYNAPPMPTSNHIENTGKTRPTKRRTLPWLEEDDLEEEDIRAAEAIAEHARATGQKEQTNSKKKAFTPLPKDSKKAAFPWNTTASAVKEQQKNLRKTNKKLSKTNDAASKLVSTDTLESKKREKAKKVFLSKEQSDVLDLVVEKQKSVFFTGSAGTGKSVLLREIISSLRKKHTREPDRVAVTASTGLAACNVGGVTLHSFSGIGLGKEPVPDLVKKIKRN